MKKTIEFENKVIALFDYDDYVEKTEYDTFEEAYKAMKHRYTDEDGYIGWDVEDWDEEYDFDEAKSEFEAYGYVEFCDRDTITTTEQFLNRKLNKII